MTEIFSFPAVASANARVLILGSMPGIRSLEQQRYYAHAQNSFWYIIENLFGIDSSLEYEQRLELVKKKNIAIWDVLKACRRGGSLDSAIESESIVANDFEIFLGQYQNIKCIFFNGSKAEQEFNKRVLPLISESHKELNYQRLPSTSPAHAAITRQEKLRQWMMVKDCLLHADC